MNKNLISRNHTAKKRSAFDIQWIVIHYVGALGDAKANTEYYKNNDVGASADFFVGHGGDVWQANDYYNFYSWHCGGGSAGTYFGKCTNKNSIGIEMCVKKTNTKTLNATDRDWYFTDQTIDATVKLVQNLMKELNIDADHVIRHYDVNGKVCPNPFVYDTGSVSWRRFKDLIAGTATDEAQGAHGLPRSKEEYLNAVAGIAVKLYKDTKILPSVVIAQCCLETGFGLGADSTILVQNNNLLGMKSELLNSTWKAQSVWNGKQISKITPEYHGGKLVYITDYFRAYPDYETCILDYEMFLLNVKLGANYKYRRIQGVTDPSVFLDYLYNNGQGYATDQNYKTKVLKLIEQYDLRKYDLIKDEEEDMAHKNPWLVTANNYNKKMMQMNAEGKQWLYSNYGCKTTWASAVKNEKYKTNCAQFVCWILRKNGVLEKGQRFWGDHGEIRWKNDETKKSVKKHCDLIHINGKKTVQQLLADKTLKAGDIVLYQNMTHTNLYAGSGCWYDAGTGYENGSGEGTKFTNWLRKYTLHAVQPVSYIIRKKAEAAQDAPVTPADGLFMVKVTTDCLNIRNGAGTAYKIVGEIKDKGVYTIVQQSGSWGKLKSGAGWISLNFTKKV